MLVEKSSSKGPLLQETRVAGLSLPGTGGLREAWGVESPSEVSHTLPYVAEVLWGCGSTPATCRGWGSARGPASRPKFSASLAFCKPPSVSEPAASLWDRLCCPILLPVLR